MNSKQFLRRTLSFGYGFVTLLGMLPVQYDQNARKFYSSVWIRAYSVAVLAAFSYLYLTSAVSAIMALNPLVAFVFVYLTHASITATVLLQCARHRGLCAVLNAAQNLAESWSYSPEASSLSWPLCKLFAKTVLVNAVAQIALVRAMCTLIQQLTGTSDWLAIGAVSMGYFMQTMVANMFYAAMLAVGVALGGLNEALGRLISDAGKVQRNQLLSERSKREEYERIAEDLDRLAEYWERLAELRVQLNAVLGWQLLCGTVNFFGILMLEMFLMYVFVAEAVLAGVAVDWSFMSNSMVYNAAIFVELQQLCAVCEKVGGQAERTSERLYGVVLVGVGERLGRSIELFSIQLHLQKMSVSLAGFVDLDNGLTTSIVGSVLSYLALLIEFHLPQAQAKFAADQTNTKLRSF